MRDLMHLGAQANPWDDPWGREEDGYIRLPNWWIILFRPNKPAALVEGLPNIVWLAGAGLILLLRR